MNSCVSCFTAIDRKKMPDTPTGLYGAVAVVLGGALMCEACWKLMTPWERVDLLMRVAVDGGGIVDRAASALNVISLTLDERM